MKEVFLVVLMVWFLGMAGCEPKPVNLKYVRYYSMIQGIKGLGVVFKDSNRIVSRLNDKQLLHDSSTLWEFMYICGDVCEIAKEDIDELAKRENPDPSLPLDKQAIAFLRSVDSVELLEQRILMYVKDRHVDSIGELVIRQKYFVTNGKLELRRLDSMLAVYKEGHGITDKDIQVVLKR